LKFPQVLLVFRHFNTISFIRNTKIKAAAEQQPTEPRRQNCGGKSRDIWIGVLTCPTLKSLKAREITSTSNLTCDCSGNLANVLADVIKAVEALDLPLVRYFVFY